MTVTKFNCWPHEVCEGIKSINARLLMPGGDKTGSQACVRWNVTFDPVKLKVVFRVFKSMEGETSIEFCSIKTVFVLFNTVVHFDTWYDNKSLIYWARGKQYVLWSRDGDVSRGAAEGNIAGRGITKHTAFPRAQ